MRVRGVDTRGVRATRASARNFCVPLLPTECGLRCLLESHCVFLFYNARCVSVVIIDRRVHSGLVCYLGIFNALKHRRRFVASHLFKCVFKWLNKVT